jgi:short-subunit dehydrogenase
VPPGHSWDGLRADLKGLPIKTTLVELGPIPTDMLDHVENYKPTHDSFRRLYRLQLLVDVPREKVAEDIVDAVAHDRRHVRHPKRAMLFALLAEAPRRTVEVLLTGVKPRL